ARFTRCNGETMQSLRLRSARLRIALISAVTAGLVGGGVLVAVSAYAAVGCRIDYAVTNQWAGGFGASVTINNLGDPINGWSLAWTFPAGQTITQVWNANANLNSSTVTATDVSYNAPIATGANTAFGFNGSWNNSSNPAPTSFTLNGTVCT